MSLRPTRRRTKSRSRTRYPPPSTAGTSIRTHQRWRWRPYWRLRRRSRARAGPRGPYVQATTTQTRCRGLAGEADASGGACRGLYRRWAVAKKKCNPVRGHRQVGRRKTGRRRSMMRERARERTWWCSQWSGSKRRGDSACPQVCWAQACMALAVVGASTGASAYARGPSACLAFGA